MARGKREVVVSGRGARRISGGHPWVYRSDVVEESGEAGDIVRVVDVRGGFLGTAFYNPGSEIRLRTVSRDDVTVDDSWFRAKVAKAVDHRESLGMDSSAYRVLHAEADGVPGLVIDRYGDFAVLQIGSASVERHQKAIVGSIVEHLGVTGVLLRGDSTSRSREGLEREDIVLYGDVPGEVEIREGNIRFIVEPWSGQKTGSFLDQRENHLAAGRIAKGRALDVFTYSGGFGLHAAKNDAVESVEFVDSSGPALKAASRNTQMNGIENATFTRGSAFDILRRKSDSGETFDTIILDPPAFAKSRRETKKAAKAYKEINLRAMKMLAPGGHLLTCSCSFHISRETLEDTLREAAADAGATMRVVEWRPQAPDHPELLNVPETRYLKCAILQKI